jgi:hypothetical protein
MVMAGNAGYLPPNGRLPTGAKLAQPIFTRQPNKPFDTDQQKTVFEYLAIGIHSLVTQMGDLARQIENRARVVDEYQVQSSTVTAESVVTVQPIFDFVPEKIESVIVTGPPTQSSTPTVNQIPLGLTGVASYSNNSVGVLQTITGGTVTAIAINGVTTGLTTGVFFVPAGGTVTVTYSVAPTVFTTAGIPVQVPAQVTLQLGDRFWNLSMPPTGVIVIAPVGILLNRNDIRQLTGASGSYSLELTGIADERFDA